MTADMHNENDNKSAKDKRMPSGSDNLDALLGGGIERGIITQVYGASGTGKTNICTQLAVQCIRNGERAVIIDTEGFSAERFSQIAKNDAKELAKDLIIYEPKDFQQQYSAVVDVEKLAGTGIGLVIVDSATLFYRFGLSPDDEGNAHTRRKLVEQLAGLHRLARKFDMAVVITNQVYTDTKTGGVCPLGGNLIEHISKTIIKMERTGNNRRRAVLMKHRSREEGQIVELIITAEGIL
ncbi:MAG: DNA repair and recombination protein RadB [ANME-2 cluster archaeon]|nr:DNA repair and recombination protein RadB [ANME-2 cluster archaeon]